MPWFFLAATVLAVAFFQLGAMSVTVAVLSIAPQGALLVVTLIALAVGAAYLWRHLKRPDRS
jgi:hypothetical protein